jgi:hypothetical protein
MGILDARFKYTPSLHTNVVSTWKRFGFKPTTEAERMARQRQTYPGGARSTGLAARASVTQLDPVKRRLRVAGK